MSHVSFQSPLPYSFQPRKVSCKYPQFIDGKIELQDLNHLARADKNQNSMWKWESLQPVLLVEQIHINLSTIGIDLENSLL